jgi:hypothetical protein
MNPQQNPSQTPDLEPAVQVPEVPAAPMPAMPDPQASPAIPQAPTIMPVVPTPSTEPAAASATSVVQGPAVAEDVDVIEKEWVDKANAVVKANADDPHAEEEAVEELQVDYLKKRYDHTVDKSQEG